MCEEFNKYRLQILVMNTKYIYKNLIFLIVLFLFSLMSILLNIPGDEPDFDIRINEFSRINFYNFLDIIVNADPVCITEGNLFITTDIRCYFYVPEIYYFIKISIYLFNTTIIIGTLQYLSKANKSEIPFFDKIFYLQFLLPGYPYFLSLFSNEVIFNTFALLYIIFYFYKVQPIIRLIILIFLPIFDIGNSIVFYIFLVLIKILNSRYFSVFNFSMLLIVIIAIIVNFRLQILINLSEITGSYYVNAVSEKIINENHTLKYSIFIRYLTPLLTFIDFRPSGLKTFIPSILILLPWLYSVFYMFTNMQLYNLAIRIFLSALFSILLVISMLPTYSNAKYYVFLFPLLSIPVFIKFDVKSIFLYSAFVSIINYLILMILRI